MIVRIQSGGIMHPPEDRVDVDSVVILTPEGVPVAAALDMNGRVWIHTAQDPQFAELMDTLGFSKRDLPKVTTIKTD